MSERTIILDGVDIKELNATRLKLLKKANKFIAEKQAFCERLANDGFENLTVETAKQFLEALEDMETVANATGATYYVPYDYDYETPWLSQLEDLEEDDWYKEVIEPIGRKLYNQLENMQYESRQWHQSTC